MKIKLDENLPARLVSALAALGHEVDTVPAEGLAGSDDSRVWAAAQADGRFLITQDLDFADVRRFVPGSHHFAPSDPWSRGALRACYASLCN